MTERRPSCIKSGSRVNLGLPIFFHDDIGLTHSVDHLKITKTIHLVYNQSMFRGKVNLIVCVSLWRVACDELLA